MKKRSSTTKKTFLPYGRQHVTPQDIEAVTRVLQSDWLTQGPTIAEFEAALGKAVSARHVVACSSGTAALHIAMLALGVGDGDVVVTTANTFLADANCARFVGADVAFTDVDPETGLMSLDSLAELLAGDTEHRVKVIIPVHFAGQPIDLASVHRLAQEHGAAVVDDACHALGATYEHDGKSYRVGGSDHSVMTAFSFHPVKHVAAGEGGAVATSDPDLAEKLKRFRNHGIVREGFENQEMSTSPEGEINPWYHEMPYPSPNYRITDIQAALGLSQLTRLDGSLERRRHLASVYDELLPQRFPGGAVVPLKTHSGKSHAYHLYVVLIDFARYGVSRAAVMNKLREAGIGTQVHYIPVPLQPYYRKLLQTSEEDFPGACDYYARALSIPMYPDLDEEDVNRVVGELEHILKQVP